MPRTSAYRLRDRPAERAFAAEWDLALDLAIGEVAETAREIALSGEQVPKTYRGKIIAMQTVHNDALLMSLLRRHAARG